MLGGCNPALPEYILTSRKVWNLLRNQIFILRIFDYSFPDIMKTSSVTRSDSKKASPKLPNEMWLKIFSNLSHEHLLQASLVCKDWCQIAWAPELKRKSKLVITRQKLKYICDIMQNNYLKCENVQLDDESGEFSSGEYKLLVQIFKHLSPHLVQVKLHGASNLSMLNNPMPKLRELDLSESWSDGIIPLHLTKSSNLKSLSMPTYDSEHLKFQLLSNLAQTAGTRLEKLSVYIGYSSIDCLGALRPYAQSLRCLKLELIVTQVDVIVEHHLADIFNKFSRLESLHIKGPFNTTAIRIIFENLPRANRLKTIILEFCVWCNGDDLLKLIVHKWSDSLESLDLRGLVVSDDLAKQLSFISHKLHSLELCLPSALMAQNLFQTIVPKANKTLTELRLMQWRPIGELFVALIQRLTHLTTLDLRDTIPTIDGKEMDYVFLHLTRLRHLFLPQCVSENDQEDLCSKSNLSNLKGLQTLHSCLCPITALQDLNFKFKELTKLELQACKRSKHSKHMPPGLKMYHQRITTNVSPTIENVPPTYHHKRITNDIGKSDGQRSRKSRSVWRNENKDIYGFVSVGGDDNIFVSKYPAH
uniref:F-box domain-containing protein n=1 Tax=Glossina pallidipes TaxID=7398 RepID=A0A1B0A610_GLOPL